MSSKTVEDIKAELNEMRDNGFLVRRMAQLLDVYESRVYGWLRPDNTYIPKANQMDTLRAFIEGGDAL